MAMQDNSSTDLQWSMSNVSSLTMEKSGKFLELGKSGQCLGSSNNSFEMMLSKSDSGIHDMNLVNGLSTADNENFEWRVKNESPDNSPPDSQDMCMASALSDIKMEPSSQHFVDIGNDVKAEMNEWTTASTTSESSPSSGQEFEAQSTSESPPRDWKQNALRYPPCAVCTGKSSGLHYGCYTCEACKNFFRRFLLRNGGFNCKKNNNCVIGNRSRGNCSGCRLKKCLSVGMSKEKSKIGRYTHSQRTETIKEVNKLEGKAYPDEIDIKVEPNCGFSFTESYDLAQATNTSACVSSESSNVCDETVDFKDEEQQLIETLISEMHGINHFGDRGSTPEGREEIIREHYDQYLAKVRLIGPLKAIPKDEYFTLLKLYNIDLDGRWKLFKQEANNCAHIVERYCKFAYKIPGFQELPLKDQEILLKIGHCDFFIILLHEGYDPERQIFLEMNGVPAHVEEAADKIFSRELIELQCNLFSRWQKANLLEDEKALLCAMALLSSDRVDLENPKAVENIHMELTLLLMKVLQKHYGRESKKRFSKFIDILTFCRQASDRYFKEYQEMSQFDMVQEVAPAFPALCPEKF
ncbi:hypothetical protein ACF0H5_007129 [Mactra antiquata]